MTLGLTSTGAVKIKTDGTLGLRAVECACCGPTDFQPCRDCPPVLGDWTFSLTGDQVGSLTTYQNPTATQYDPPRNCEDSWSAFSGTNSMDQKSFGVNLVRAYGGWYGAPFGTPCCWVLSLFVQGTFDYCCFMGYPDLCSVISSDSVIITSDSPVGSYNFTVYGQCKPPCYTGAPDCQDEPFAFNFTVTVS